VALAAAGAGGVAEHTVGAYTDGYLRERGKNCADNRDCVAQVHERISVGVGAGMVAYIVWVFLL